MVGHLHLPPPPPGTYSRAGGPSGIHSIDGWLSCIAGLHKVQENLLHLPGIEGDPGPETRSLVTTPTELPAVHKHTGVHFYETLLDDILENTRYNRLMV
jgi:hypothetical protein